MREEFIRKLYEKHFDTVFQYLLPKLGFDNDAAADCAHAVFDKAMEKYDKLKDHPNVLGWLMTTAKHLLHKSWRKSARKAARDLPLELACAVPDGRDPFEAVELTDADIKSITEIVLSGLKENELAVYRMYFVQNLSFEDIAQSLGISQQAVRARLARVKAKLKNRIAELT